MREIWFGVSASVIDWRTCRFQIATEWEICQFRWLDFAVKEVVKLSVFFFIFLIFYKSIIFCFFWSFRPTDMHNVNSIESRPFGSFTSAASSSASYQLQSYIRFSIGLTVCLQWRYGATKLHLMNLCALNWIRGKWTRLVSNTTYYSNNQIIEYIKMKLPAIQSRYILSPRHQRHIAKKGKWRRWVQKKFNKNRECNQQKLKFNRN